MSYDKSIRVVLRGLDEAIRKVNQTPKRLESVLENPRTLRKIGMVLKASAIETYAQGGRPKWKDNAPSTKAAKLKKYKKASAVMVGTGSLRQSLDSKVTGGQLYLTSNEYLKYHQFETNRVKARFPARPVWGAHEEDLLDIKEIIVEDASA